VGFLDWLLGKKDRTTSPSRPVPPESAPPTATRPVPQETAPPGGPPPMSANGVERREPAAPRQEERLPAGSPERPPAAPAKAELPPSRAENLRRWRDAGQARVWVEAHNGDWNHADWLALIEDLQRSPFWPLEPDEVGRTLEEEKARWWKGK